MPNMSTESIGANDELRAPEPVAPSLTLKELTTVLVKHYGLNEGQFDLLLEYQFGVGQFGPTPETKLPGVTVGLSKLGLIRSPAPGPQTVDAAEINVVLKPRVTKTTTRKRRITG